MIKNTRFLTILLLSTVSVLNADPAPVAVATVNKCPKVVVVSIQEIGQKSKKFASVQKKIEGDIQKRGMEIEDLKTQYTTTVEKLQNGGKDMTPTAQQQHHEKLAEYKGKIEVKQQGLQAYAEREMRHAEESLIKDIQEICKKLDFDIVIPGALYVKPEFDMTGSVMKEMDKNVANNANEAVGVKRKLEEVEKEVENVAKKIKKAL
jgi:Skp family chaperone for outer membrane proteins